jgi:membrane AbrB-like protein
MVWMRFPGGLLFGSMAGSAILHGAGWVHAVLPWWLGSAAVIVLGAVAGSRFANTSFRMVLDYLGAALGSFAVSIVVATTFVFLVTIFLPFRPADVVIAFAPGSQDQMMLLALALHLDPVFVGAHHLSRWLVVTFSIAALSRYFTRGRSQPREKKRWKRPGQGTFDD